MDLKDFTPKAVQGLYTMNHYEAPNGMWIQTVANFKPISPTNPAIFSYGENDTRRHIPFESFESLAAFIKEL